MHLFDFFNNQWFWFLKMFRVKELFLLNKSESETIGSGPFRNIKESTVCMKNSTHKNSQFVRQFFEYLNFFRESRFYTKTGFVSFFTSVE